MAALVCTRPIQVIQLSNILNANEPRYGEYVAGVASGDPPYYQLFNAYAAGELMGAADWLQYVDPNGAQPWAVPMNTALAAIADKLIADTFAYEYMVQSINTVTVLLELRQNSLYNSAIRYTQSLYWQSIGHADSLYNSAIGYSQYLYNASIGHANSLYNSAIGYSQYLYNAAVGHADNLYNASISHADVLYNAGIDYTNATAHNLQSNINGVEARVDQLIGTDVSALVQSITDVANTAQMEVQNAVKEAESVAATLVAGAGAAAVAKVLTALQPQIDAIKTEADQCLAPLCDSVTPNAKQLGKLGNLLHDLTDVGLLGILLAVLVEAAHDPGRLVADAENDLGGIVDGVASGLRSLIGV